MNGEEIQSLINQLKASGLEEEQIMDVFYETFKKGEMSREDLEALSNAMGYELTDEFKKDETPDPIISGSEEGSGITKEEAEAAKALEPGESKEEFKEKIEEAKSTAEEGKEKAEESEEEKSEEEKKEEVKTEPEKSEEESEEEDWEKAQKLFRI